MKQELLSSIEEILSSSTSIKNHIDRVYELRTKLSDLLTDDERVQLVSRIKARVQTEAEQAFVNAGAWGAIFAATGTGKSKIAIDYSHKLVSRVNTAKILLSVPTEKLRDETWHDEFVKWGMGNIWNFNVEKTCYASLHKYEGQVFDFVILDEGHNITELNSTFFEKNTVRSIMLLTATKPRDLIKRDILRELNISPVYELSLDESVKLGLIAPYDITVVTMHLDSTDKYIRAGRKDKPFMTTEKANYGYLSARLSAMPNRMGFIDRMRFIYNLRSKTQAAKWLLENVIPKDSRTLIFCGSKAQANEVCEHRFYSRPTPPKKLKENATPAKIAKYEREYQEYQVALKEYQGDESYDLFMKMLIPRMSCVNALNEGQNIPDLDIGFVVQLNSNELHLIQRIGRLLRYRPNHIGKIIILCVIDSIDKEWVKKATANLDFANTRVVELSHLKMGIDTITFD